MDSTLDFPLFGDSISIVEQHSQALINIIQSKYGCQVHIDGVESNAGIGLGKPVFVPERRVSFTLSKGLLVSVWKADLTDFPVDAVVNAANEYLQHDGGLAKALCDAGGSEIQRESKRLIDKNGQLNTGDAVITNAGRLPCKMIIHAVGPSLPHKPNTSAVKKATPLLKKAVLKILTIAEDQKLGTVAIPALSSGLFHFPLPECANIIVSAVKQYHDHSFSGTLCEVFLVNNDEPTVFHMERACCEVFSDKLQSYSQAAQKPGKGAAQASPCTVKIGKVTLILKKGKLQEQQADVIVNTTSPDMNLSVGQISCALLNKAGKEMQDEIEKCRYRISHGQHVIVTSSYRLRCKQVYHTLCVQKGTSKTHESPEKILSSAITECLHLAAKNNHSSIVFPAIGTGNLKFSRDEVSQIMISAAVDFAKMYQNLMDIHFVIYPSEEATFRVMLDKLQELKAFHAKMNNVDNMGQHGSSQGFTQHNFVNREVSTLNIRLNATSAETTHEARRWVKHLFCSSNCVTICNSFIQYFGEQEYQKLSRETKSGVSIVEVLDKGCARIQIKGNSIEDVIVVVLQVEYMLCQIQRKFIREEEYDMTTMSQSVPYERKAVERYDTEFTKRENIMMSGLKVIKVEKVENHTLKNLFELKRKQLNTHVHGHTMYQRISAQFCNMVCHIGFQREYTPPYDPEYGDGIYFAESVNEAMNVWKNMAEEEYIYFVEAQVLTGNSILGSRDLIVPPAVSTDPLNLFDSVKGRSGVHVIFSGYQALPKYIIICKKMQTESIVSIM